MGCGFCQSNESKIFDQQSLMTIIHSVHFPDLHLQFFMEQPSRIERECLMIFTNSTFNTIDCAFFKALGNGHQDKLHNELKKQTENASVKVGDFLLIENPLKVFKIRYLLLVVVPVWKRQDANEDIALAFRKSYGEVIRLQMKTLIICEPCGYLGIPNNVAAKVIMNGIHNTKSSLKEITFFFSHKRNQTYYHEVASKYDQMKSISQVHSDY